MNNDMEQKDLQITGSGGDPRFIFHFASDVIVHSCMNIRLLCTSS